MTITRLPSSLTPAAFTKKITHRSPNTAHKQLYGDNPVITTYPSEIKEKPPQSQVPALAKPIEDKEDKHKNQDTVNTSREPFKRQFSDLLKQLANWKLGEGKHNAQIEHFKNALFTPGYADHQSSHYFESIKLNLENIYALLNDEKIPSTKRITTYKTLCTFLHVCGPGVFAHIENALNDLDSENTIENWLAQFRTDLIDSYAKEFHYQLYPDKLDERRVGNQVHTVNGFMRHAANAGWNPTTEIDYKDNFIFGISEADYKIFLTHLEKSYTLSTISDHIADKILMLIQDKIDIESLAVDKNYGIRFDKGFNEFVTWLESQVNQLFKPKKINIYELIEINPSIGDPPKTYIKLQLNQDYLYRHVIEYAMDNKLIDLKEYEKQTIKLGQRTFLSSHYHPYPTHPEKDASRYAHWTALPDDDLKNLLTYTRQIYLSERSKASDAINPDKKVIAYYKNGESKLTTQTIQPDLQHPKEDLDDSYNGLLRSIVAHAEKAGKSHTLAMLRRPTINIRKHIQAEIDSKSSDPDLTRLNVLRKELQLTTQSDIQNNISDRNFFEDHYQQRVYIQNKDLSYKIFSTPTITQLENWRSLSDEDTACLVYCLKYTKEYLPTYDILLFDSIEHDKVKTFAVMAQTQGFKLKERFMKILFYASGKGAEKIVERMLEINKEFKHDINSFDNASKSPADADNALFYAATYNHINTVKHLLRAGANIHAQNISEKTVFHAATLHSSIDVLSELSARIRLDTTITPEAKKKLFNAQQKNNDVTAMTLSVCNDNSTSIKLLIESGADVNLLIQTAASYSKYSAIFVAVQLLKNNALKTLMEHKADVNARFGETQASLSLVAINARNTTALKLLIHAGVTNSDIHGYSLLYHAVSASSPTAIAALLENKVDMDAKKFPKELTAMIYAFNRRDLELLTQLSKAGAKTSEALDALLKIPPKEFQLLDQLAKSIIPYMDLNEKDEQGHYVIHKFSNILFYINLLLENPNFRQAVNFIDQKQETFLHSTIQSDLPGAANTLNRLINIGANVNQVNHTGDSPLHSAVKNKNHDALRRLLKCDNINLDQKNTAGETALALAIKTDNQQAVRLLQKRFFMNRAYYPRIVDNKPREIDTLLSKIRTKLLLSYAQEHSMSHEATKRLSEYDFNIDSQDYWALDIPLITANKNIPLTTFLIAHLESNFIPSNIVSYLLNLALPLVVTHQPYDDNHKKLTAWFEKLDMQIDVNKVLLKDEMGTQSINKTYLRSQFLIYLCKQKICNEKFINDDKILLASGEYLKHELIPLNENFSYWENRTDNEAIDLLEYYWKNKNSTEVEAKDATAFFSRLPLEKAKAWIALADQTGRSRELEYLVKYTAPLRVGALVNSKIVLQNLLDEKATSEHRSLAQQLNITKLEDIKDRTFFLDHYLPPENTLENWKKLSDAETELLFCILKANGNFKENIGFNLTLLKVFSEQDKIKSFKLLSKDNAITRDIFTDNLQIAVKSDSTQVARQLLEIYQIPDGGIETTFSDPTYKSFTPLLVACMGKDPDMVSLLLEYKANIAATTKDGITAFHCATIYSNSKIISLLVNALKKNKKLSLHDKKALLDIMWSSEQLEYKATTLVQAVENDNPEIISLLVEAGANIELGSEPISESGRSSPPIYIALNNGKNKALEALIKQKANIHYINDEKTQKSLALIAIEKNNPDALRLLIQAGLTKSDKDFHSLLYHAVKLKSANCIDILLENKTDLDARNFPYHKTAVMFALENKDSNLLTQLIKAGAKTSEAVMTALLTDNKQYFLQLINAGMSLAKKDEKDTLVIHQFAKRPTWITDIPLGTTPQIINAQDFNGNTLLQLIIKTNESNNIKSALTTLVNLGADINIVNTEGNTPLHTAIQFKNYAAISYLISQKNINLEYKNKEQKSALDLTIESQDKIVNQLISRKQLTQNAFPKNDTSISDFLMQDLLTIKQTLSQDINPTTGISDFELSYTPTYIINHFIERVQKLDASAKGDAERINLHLQTLKIPADSKMFYTADKKLNIDYFNNLFLDYFCKEQIFDKKYIDRDSLTLTKRQYLKSAYIPPYENIKNWQRLSEESTIELLDYIEKDLKDEKNINHEFYNELLLNAVNSDQPKLINRLLDKYNESTARELIRKLSKTGQAALEKLFYAGLLTKIPDPLDIFISATFDGNKKLLSALLKHKGSINLEQKTSSGNTLMMTAASHQSFNHEIIRLLIKTGCKTSYVIKQAILSQNISTYNVLLNLGADLNEKDEQGKMLIDYIPENYALEFCSRNLIFVKKLIIHNLLNKDDKHRINLERLFLKISIADKSKIDVYMYITNLLLKLELILNNTHYQSPLRKTIFANLVEPAMAIDNRTDAYALALELDRVGNYIADVNKLLSCTPASMHHDLHTLVLDLFTKSKDSKIMLFDTKTPYAYINAKKCITDITKSTKHLQASIKVLTSHLQPYINDKSDLSIYTSSTTFTFFEKSTQRKLLASGLLKEIKTCLNSINNNSNYELQIIAIEKFLMTIDSCLEKYKLVKSNDTNDHLYFILAPIFTIKRIAITIVEEWQLLKNLINQDQTMTATAADEKPAISSYRKIPKK
jgi:ankyrin repeat protein